MEGRVERGNSISTAVAPPLNCKNASQERISW